MAASPCIGQVGGIGDDVYNFRSKGTLTVVQTRSGQLVETLQKAARDHTFGTRLSVRLFLGHGVAPRIPDDIPWHDDFVQLEADIPVTSHPSIARLAYFGACAQERRQPSSIFTSELGLFESVVEKPPLKGRSDITLEVLQPSLDRSTIARLLAIYRTRYDSYLTQLTDSWLCKMVERNVVAVARDASGIIQSVCVAELATFRFPGAPDIDFAELTDAATAKETEGRGYYATLKRWMTYELRRTHPLRVITTEARANSARVLRSNLGIGFVKAGYQPAHCVIRSSSDEAVEQVGPYGDLVVFYVP